MKKLFILNFILLIATGSCMATDLLYVNFARVLLGDEPKKHISIISPKSYKTLKALPTSKYNYQNDPNILKFIKSKFPIIRCVSFDSFCQRNDSIVFIIKEFGALSRKPLPILRDTTWIVILESPFDEWGNIVPNYLLTEETRVALRDYKFINKDTFFSIPSPQESNGFCLQWDSGLSPLPNDVATASDDLIGDIKLLSSLFCGQKREPQDGIDAICKNLKILKSEIGKQIAQQMIDILKGKI